MILLESIGKVVLVGILRLGMKLGLIKVPLCGKGLGEKSLELWLRILTCLLHEWELILCTGDWSVLLLEWICRAKTSLKFGKGLPICWKWVNK